MFTDTPMSEDNTDEIQTCLPGLQQCQFPVCDIALELCKMLTLGLSG